MKISRISKKSKFNSAKKQISSAKHAPKRVNITMKDMKREWFMFKVKKMDQPITLNFTIENLSFNPEILKNGVNPVVKKEFDLSYTKIKGKIVIKYNQETDPKTMSLNFHYKYDPIVDGKLYFAMNYPYSYIKYVRRFKKLIRRYSKTNSVYLRRQRLTQTSDSRSLDIYWLTGLGAMEKSPKLA